MLGDGTQGIGEAGELLYAGEHESACEDGDGETGEAGSVAVDLGEAVGDDGDDEDVVDPKDDFQNREDAQAAPSCRTGDEVEECHLLVGYDDNDLPRGKQDSFRPFKIDLLKSI